MESTYLYVGSKNKTSEKNIYSVQILSKFTEVIVLSHFEPLPASACVFASNEMFLFK